MRRGVIREVAQVSRKCGLICGGPIRGGGEFVGEEIRYMN